jgi:hypothetical protein
MVAKMLTQTNFPVIPGRAAGANPESRKQRGASIWIPGSPLRGAPE